MEILIVIAIIASFAAFTLIPQFSGPILLGIGLAFVAVGLLIGVPIGLYYHILLFRRKDLIREGLRRWWISPQRYHKKFPDKDMKLLNRWFWIGAMFFNIAMLGCGLVLIGLLTT